MIGTAVLLGVLGALLAPRAAALAGDASSAWTGRVPLALLAAAGGAAAAAVADGVAELVGLAGLALGCAVLVAVDLACHRLPDVVMLPTALVLLGGLTVAAATAASWPTLGRAALGGLALGTGFLVLALISPRAIGLGDVKLAGVLGVLLGWFGWDALLLGLVATFVLGGVVALLLLATRRASRSTPLAFGPWLVLGAVCGVTMVELAAAGFTP